LTTFYIGNNNISKIDELNVLTNLPELIDIVFTGNPFYYKDGDIKKQEEIPGVKQEICKRIVSSSVTIDGELMVTQK
jgi:hypothetical protein